MQHDGIAFLEEVFSLAFVAEGMIVVKFTGSTIISAAACLVAAYYVFNAEYPQGSNWHRQKQLYVPRAYSAWKDSAWKDWSNSVNRC